MTTTTLQTLIDERDVREVLTRYCRAIDRCDETLLTSVYWPDATEDHLGTVSTVAEFVSDSIKLLRKEMKCTMHFISNTTIKLHGDIALTETYVIGYHLLNRDGKVEMTLGARYLDRFERLNGEWRIAERKAVVDWEQNGAALLGEELTNKLTSVDTRHTGEVSYRLFANRTVKQ